MLLTLLSFVGIAVVQPAATTSGSGHPVYWQGKRKKRKLVDQPNKHLEYILHKVVSEYYRDIVESDLPKEVKKEAAKVVRPFVDKKVQGIPKTNSVDWIALQRESDRIGLLLEIWNEELIAAEIDDEEILLLS